MILVSGCLLGLCCRYDGKEKEFEDVLDYLKDKTYIPICPEQMGGLSTPRDPAEIVTNDPLSIQTETGVDVTGQFLKGVDEVVKLLSLYDVKEAILKSRSPSCGTYQIYDGTFNRTLINGSGVMSKRLQEASVKVINEEDLV
ncbi:MAG: DUF523 domain-containing protein [Clostridiales bacterium]|nr:DUF523 domain-containing protein [Clostridiales bacterium]